jgi:hypothetical protein
MSVFLSYAYDDKPRIRKLLDQLKAKGMLSPHEEVFDSSESIVPGSIWRDQIRKAVENASQFIVVWSNAAHTSDWVNYEIGMAEALDKPILVVVPKGEMSRIPANLDKIQVIEIEETK